MTDFAPCGCPHAVPSQAVPAGVTCCYLTGCCCGRVNLHRERAGSWDQWPWRPGRKVGRTIYVMAGDEPSDDDVLIGMMDTGWYAEVVCRDHNAALAVTRSQSDPT